MIMTITQNDKNVNHMFRFDKNKTNFLSVIVIYKNTLCFCDTHLQKTLFTQKKCDVMILSLRMCNNYNKCNTSTRISNVVSKQL